VAYSVFKETLSFGGCGCSWLRAKKLFQGFVAFETSHGSIPLECHLKKSKEMFSSTGKVLKVFKSPMITSNNTSAWSLQGNLHLDC